MERSTVKINHIVRLIPIVLALLITTQDLCAQHEPDSMEMSAFRKGRNLVGMGGFVSSASLAGSQLASDPGRPGNNYTFDVRLGRFIADKNLLGLSFNTTRTQLVGYVEVQAEILGVGPWYRLYTGKQHNLALFLQTTVQYAGYYGRSSGIQQLRAVDEEILARGVNGSLGLGICYAVTDRISFEASSDFQLARFWGTIQDNVLTMKEEIVSDRYKLLFSFGINLFFGKLKDYDR